MSNEENPMSNEEPAAATPAAVDGVPAGTPRKSRARRVLKRVALAVGALVAVLFVVVAFLLGPIVKFGVNTFGASFLGVDECSIASARIYPLTGYARFEKIRVGKPVAENVAFTKDLLSVGLLEVDVDMFSLPTRKKTLEFFALLDVDAEYEQLLSGETNLGMILDKVTGGNAVAAGGEKETPASRPAEKPVPAAEQKPAEAIYVAAHYFVIRNMRVRMTVNGMPLVLPAISADFSDGLGLDQDLTPVAFGMRVGGDFANAFDFLRKSVVGDAAGAAVGAVSDAAVMTGDAAKAAADVTVDAVSGAAALTGDAVSEAAGAVVDVVDAVGKIFEGSGRSADEEKEADAGN